MLKELDTENKIDVISRTVDKDHRCDSDTNSKTSQVRLFQDLTKHDLIFSKSRVELEIDKEKKKVPEYLRLRGKKYVKPVLVSYGSFGFVLKYFEEDLTDSISHKKTVCVKIRKKKDGLETDLSVLKKQRAGEISVMKEVFVPGVVRSGRIVMPLLSSDVKELVNFDTTKCIDIIRILAEHMLKLVESGFYYTDLKLDNILYYYDHGELKIMLCDHGSLFSKNESAIFTYFAPERVKKENEQFRDPWEGDIVWGIGAVLCELLNIEPIFDRDEWDEKSDEAFRVVVTELCKKIPEREDLIRKIFVETGRISLKDLVLELNSPGRPVTAQINSSGCSITGSAGSDQRSDQVSDVVSDKASTSKNTGLM
ncbi:putative protein kinase [Yasminevirus sp. GU-2018]|uniref:Protein kinase domain-containing protein n=1 Tax=Yasminevirus sp. GU-2018 TaxID=2420051 RepID=A0A5K0U9E1_9VIRU|nr:putative protein kinase [Yasminevirus sp. GU-2018]